MPPEAPNRTPNQHPSARHPGTTKEGSQFSEEAVKAVWLKSRRIPDFSHTEWATDTCGDRIRFSYYGKTPSEFAWEIDHILPVGQGGTDDIDNLQPLQWENNRKKGNTHPWNCGDERA